MALLRRVDGLVQFTKHILRLVKQKETITSTEPKFFP